MKFHRDRPDSGGTASLFAMAMATPAAAQAVPSDDAGAATAVKQELRIPWM